MCVWIVIYIVKYIHMHIRTYEFPLEISSVTIVDIISPQKRNICSFRKRVSLLKGTVANHHLEVTHKSSLLFPTIFLRRPKYRPGTPGCKPLSLTCHWCSHIAFERKHWGDVSKTYCGDHAIYTNTKWLFCTPETNIYVNLKKKTLYQT